MWMWNLEETMSVYGGKELAAAFRTVRKNTVQIAEEIPESKYDFKPAPETRSVAQMLAHIAIAPKYFEYAHANKVTDMTTVNFMEIAQPIMAEETKPRTKAELVDLLKSEGERFAAFLEGMSDSFLAERVTMPPQAGGSKTRFEMLLGPKEHEMHHRGQLMLVERMIGLVPHLTRQFQERMAQMQQQQQAAAGQR
jgi:uncharacterized damage-inducible protein DinB